MTNRCCAALLLLLLLTCGTAVAQRHRLSLGYGFPTHEQFWTGRFDWEKSNLLSSPQDANAELARDLLRTSENIYLGDSRYSNAITLQYDYLLNRYLSVGIAGAYEQEADQIYFYDTKARRQIAVGDYHRRAFTLAPALNVAYTPPGPVRIYGLVGVGGTLVVQTYRGDGGSRNFTGAHYTVQISPFCMRFGSTFSAWFEMGFGYKGILSAGAAYVF